MKRTWEILGQAWTADLIRRISSRLKLHSDTVGAWKRPVESDEFPTGSGKANIIDHIKFVLREIHKSLPGVAWEIVEHLVDYVNQLDRLEGINKSRNGETICSMIAESAKEHTDIVLEYLHNPRRDWGKIYSEIQESKASLNKLEACVKEEMKKQAENAAIKEEK